MGLDTNNVAGLVLLVFGLYLLTHQDRLKRPPMLLVIFAGVALDLLAWWLIGRGAGSRDVGAVLQLLGNLAALAGTVLSVMDIELPSVRIERHKTPTVARPPVQVERVENKVP
jgi:hypothetical protein